MRTMSIKHSLISKHGILETPPPYRKEWLDENGLEVHYAHGRAVLRFKA